MSREVFYGRSIRPSKGSRMAKGIVGWRTADGRKFLLLFRTARQIVESIDLLEKSLSRLTLTAETLSNKNITTAFNNFGLGKQYTSIADNGKDIFYQRELQTQPEIISNKMAKGYILKDFPLNMFLFFYMWP